MIAIVLSVLTICTALPLSALAAGINLGEQTDKVNIPISVSSHYGHELHTTTIGGVTYPLFCIEYGAPSPSSSSLASQGVPSDANVLEAARWIFAGYYMQHGNDIDWLDMAYCQKKVWSLLGSEVSWSFSNEGYNAWVSQAQNNMNRLNVRPSFDGKNIGNYLAGKTYNITDTNGVLMDYPAFTQDSNGIRIVHNEGSNDLVITIDKTCSQTSFNIRDNTYYKSITGNANECLIYNPIAGGTQKLMYSAYYDPVSFWLEGDVTPLGHIEISKQDYYGASVDGTQFGLYTDANCTNQIATSTSTDGKVRFEYLEPNRYYIKELKASTGYLISDVVSGITVSSNQTSRSTIQNAEPKGTINLTKKLDVSKTNGKYGDIKIGEAQYSLYAADKVTSKAGTKIFYQKDQLVETKQLNVTDGTTGTITWSNLPLGSYYIKETKEPTGTFIDNSRYDVTLSYKDQVTPVIIDSSTVSTDIVKSMKVNIFKEGTGGEAGLKIGVKGAEFTIKLYADYQSALQQGYRYEEIWAYKNSDGNWQGINIYGQEVNVDAQRAEAANKIAPPYAVITSNSEGNAVSDYIPYGRYITKETKTPVDYQSGSDFVFSITNDESEVSVELKVKRLTVNNSPFEAPVKIVKKDIDSDKTVTLSSATFKIRATEDVLNKETGKVLYSKGEFIEYKIGSNRFNEFTTNSDNFIVPIGNNYSTSNDEKGTVLTPFKLPAGYYEIVEIKNPDGFLLATDPLAFVVTSINDYDVDEDGETVIVLNFNNEQPKGKLTIDKSFFERSDIDTSLIGTIDYTQIGFELKAVKDVIDMSDGSVVYKAGDSIGIYYLDENATLTIDNIWMGEYTVQEISTIKGAVLDNTAYPINFVYKDNTTKEYTKILNIENFTTEVDISKTDITKEPELEGAKLTVTDKDGNVIDEWVSTTESHKIEGLIVGETYTLKEEIAPDGYVLANEIQFAVENTKEPQIVKMVDKRVEISKQDVTTGKELEGAELTITDKDGNIVDSWTSTKEPHFAKGLVEGETYTLTEVTAPYGFEIAENVEFTVTANKENQKVVMKDDYIYSTVRVIKCDITTKKAILSNDFEFSIYSDADCKDLISTSGANQDEGTALFEKLKYGTYYIAETKAPLGYALSDQVVEVIIDENGVSADGKNLEESDGIYSFEYYDELLPIINTGDTFNSIGLFIGLCIILVLAVFALAVVLIKNKKKKESD